MVGEVSGPEEGGECGEGEARGGGRGGGADEQVVEEGGGGGEEREVEAGEGGGEVWVRRKVGYDAAEVVWAPANLAGDEETAEEREEARWRRHFPSGGGRGSVRLNIFKAYYLDRHYINKNSIDFKMK